MKKNNYDNNLIVFEGIDGTGKTSTSRLIVEKINNEARRNNKANFDQDTKKLLKSKLTGLIKEQSLEFFLENVVYGGAIRFEDLELINPTSSLKSSAKKDSEQDISFYVYLLSALYKDKVIIALLPYVNVVMDRYIYSVLAHHEAYGVNTESFNLKEFSIAAPDYFFLMKVKEKERKQRLENRGNMTSGDMRQKVKGSVLEKIEKIFERYFPIIIDSTNTSVEQVVDCVSKFIHSKKREFTNYNKNIAFDCDKYLEIQLKTIENRMQLVPKGGSIYIEFGGKAYDDQHAARVLPGYDPDAKLELLKKLSRNFEIVVAVSARDILKPRVRGDSRLFYNRETIRLIKALKDKEINVDHGVLTMVKDHYSLKEMDKITSFIGMANKELQVIFVKHSFIKNYPSLKILSREGVFSGNQKLNTTGKNILLLSPGGGSGKFGVCLSELYHDFKAGKNSLYIKFETFPVFNLPTKHAINLAYVVATADLGNRVMEESNNGLTTYDKDIDNFALLNLLIYKFCPDKNQNVMSQYKFPSDMGINRLKSGFINEDKIIEASILEIKRRIKRYEEEISYGIEKKEIIKYIEKILSSTINFFPGII